MRACYLFTYFTRNGEDGLHLAASEDGYNWERLNGGRSYLTPTVGNAKLMRDPSIARAPDGTFHLVWTSGWTENNIGYASTRDFVHWSAQREIPVMAHERTVRNAWAPEIAYDAKREEYLIFWASTIPEKFTATAASSEEEYNHRMYFTTTKDFVSFTPTAVYYDPGFSVIDATMVQTGGKYFLIFKDETVTPPRKYLQVAEADDIRGPFGTPSAAFTPPGLWVEGPTVAKVGEDFILYYDAYITNHYGAMRSRDLRKWEDVTPKLRLPDEGTPERVRHGTVIQVEPEVIANLRRAE